MDKTTIYKLQKGTEWFLSDYVLWIPIQIWKKRSKTMLWKVVATTMIAFFYFSTAISTYKLVLYWYSITHPLAVDKSQLTRDAITDVVDGYSSAIRQGNCEKSPTFELKFLGATTEEKQAWVKNCEEYTKTQRDYSLSVYKFEDIRDSSVQIRFFEIREVLSDGKVVRHFFE